MQLRVQRSMLSQVPWGLVAIVLVTALLGIWNLASAARPPRDVWGQQVVFLGVGLAAAVVVALVDLRWIQRMAWGIYVVNIALLLALPFIGHTAKGAESWIVLGPLRLQPAEFMKIGVILLLARYFHDTYRPQDDRYGLARLLLPIAIVGVPFILVLVQPDLGTAMMISLTGLTLILFARPTRSLIVLLIVGVVACTGILWNDYVRTDPDRTTVLRHHLKPHQSNRISGWLDPESDQLGVNYHAAQSKIAVGSGGLTGKGWRQGTQTGLSFLPEQHTDFIFSVWAEEHGFLACLLLIALYGAFLMLALNVAHGARDRFGAFLAVGIAALIFWQVFENIGMVIGLLPVTGITLPLMSYGGSSILSTLLMIGLLANVSMRRHIF